MRIVYLSPLGAIGGAEQCLLNIIASLRNSHPDAEVFLISAGDGPLVTRAAALGVTVRIVSMPAALAGLGDSILGRRSGAIQFARMIAIATVALPSALAYLLALKREIRRIDPHVIHSNGLKMHLLASLVPPNRARLIWHMHDFLTARPAMARALRWASARCAGVIAISDAVASDVREVLPTTPVNLIYNGIDLHYFTKGHNGLAGTDGKADLDALANLPAPEEPIIRIGLVATFARWKGQDVLIEAAARYFEKNQNSRVRFYIIGGPIYHTRGSQFSEAELRRHAAAAGLEGRVGFIPFQPDTRAIYRALDVVVHASTRPEPFGLTIAEAMACGRPVIVSSAGGAMELFTPNVDAIGVPPGDVELLVAAISRLVSDPRRRASLGRQASTTALRRFCRDRLGKQVIDVYEKLLK